MKLKTAYIILISLTATAVMATSYSGPVRQTVYSADGKFCAVINPAGTVQEVFRASSMKKAAWSFAFSPEADTWFVSNNGEYVVCVRWRFVRVEDIDKPAVTVFMKNQGRKDYTYSSLTKARRPGFFEAAPKGDFWRIWFEHVNTADNRVEIFCGDKNRIVIEGEDGRLKLFRD